MSAKIDFNNHGREFEKEISVIMPAFLKSRYFAGANPFERNLFNFMLYEYGDFMPLSFKQWDEIYTYR